MFCVVPVAVMGSIVAVVGIDSEAVMCIVVIVLLIGVVVLLCTLISRKVPVVVGIVVSFIVIGVSVVVT